MASKIRIGHGERGRLFRGRARDVEGRRMVHFADPAGMAAAVEIRMQPDVEQVLRLFRLGVDA